MLDELDIVVLTRDIDEYNLQRGDLGTIVHRYGQGEAFEVEFVTVTGKTVAVLTVTRADICPVGGTEVLHARQPELAVA